MRIPSRHLHTGFSLIELLVATAIGLLTVLAIMQSLTSFDSLRRTAAGTGNNQVNGALSLYAVERDLRMAGYGLMGANSTGANVNPNGIIAICGSGTGVTHAYSSRRTNAADTKDFVYNSTLPFVPFAINPSGVTAGDTGSDVVSIIYGAGSGMVTDRTKITADLAPPVVTVENRPGFHTGELAVLVGPIASANCDIVEITKLPNSGMCSDTSGTATDVRIGTGSYANYWNSSPPGANCGNSTATYNNPSGTSTSSINEGRIVSLGQRENFVSKVYALRGGSLRVCDMLTHDCTRDTSASAATPMTSTELIAYWKPIAAGIVAFRVEYTTRTSGTTWVKSIPTNWTDVTAARVVVVARNDQRERDPLPRTATSIPDTLGHIPYAGGTGTNYIDLTVVDNDPVDNWQHFRYKQVESKFMLPNLVGGKQLTVAPN